MTSDLIPNELSVEYIKDPLGIDLARPQFTWNFISDGKNKFQSAYRILVASSPDLIREENADLWDSGKIKSGNSVSITYEGNPLESFKTYFWAIMVWDEKGNPTSWSNISKFETSILNEMEWNAEWIGDGKPVPEKDEDFYEILPAPMFRKTFQVGGDIKKARLYISGLGYYEAYLNGQKVGEHVLDPGWTNYGKEVLYATYDITQLLNKGNNAIGVLLGNGWYNPLPLGLFRKFNLRKYLTIGRPKLIAQIRIEMENGDIITIVSDDTWKKLDSFILKNNVYLGELQDGRLKLDGWSLPDFNDSDWEDVIVETAPGGDLNAQMVPPIKITGILEPVKLNEPEPGVYVYDLGQNFAGWINFKVHEKVGTEIKFLYGELLNEDGTVNGMTTVAGHIKEIWNLSGGPGAPKTANQIDQYIASGKEKDVFQQHFTFHGFRYVEITGLTKDPALDDLQGIRLSADLSDAGNITCSNELFNQVQDVVEWTFLSNVFSIQSDCPGREKLGYGADIVTSAEAFIYNYNMANFYRKTVFDFAHDVRPNGGMPECAPYNGIDTKGFGEGTGPIGWQLAFPFVQKQLYIFYGDKNIIEDNYDLTKGMIEFLRSQAKDNLIYHGISDHVSVDPKPEALTSSAFYYHNVKLLSEFAEILGKKDDADTYKAVANSIKEAFINKFLIPNTGKFDTLTTQITQVFALWYDLVPENERITAFDVLIDEILQKHKGHLSTGIFGTKMLFDVLREHNRNDVAFTIVNQRDYPGYGYMIENDATTLWENWDLPDQNSLNHPMFGSVSEWYYRSLVGINPKPDAYGFDKIYIKPFIVGDLSAVDGYYQSIRGNIKSSWTLNDDSLELDIVIPPNIDADIHVPTSDPDLIRFDGKRASEIKTLEFIGYDNGFAVYHAGNGKYHILSKL